MAHHYTAGLAEFVAGLKYEDIPVEVVERVKLLALDSIGCGLLGAAMPWSARLLDTLKEIEAPGDALVEAVRGLDRLDDVARLAELIRA